MQPPLPRDEGRSCSQSPTHIGRDYADAPLLEAETLGETRAHNVWELGGTVHRKLIHAAVPEGDHSLALHRHGCLTVHPKFTFDHDRSLSRDRIEVTGVDESLEYNVVAPVLVQQRRARLPGLEHIRHHAQIFVVERDIPGEIFGLGTSVSYAHRDRFANEPDLAKREDRVVRDFVTRKLGYRPDWFNSIEVIRDEHGPARCRRHLDRTNLRVCNSASDKGDVLNPY